MISVESAKAILQQSVIPLTTTECIKVNEGLGYTLAEDVVAPIHLPPFNQSNVDGYAVRIASETPNVWAVIGEIKAGDAPNGALKAGEAVRIFTGAMVPETADLVIMQEHCTRMENRLECSATSLKKGEHIRYKGAQIKQGDLALSKNTLVNPITIGFLSGLGLDTITVYKQPKIALVITGNELQMPGNSLTEGKVFESNSTALQSAIQLMGLKVDNLLFAKDDKNSLKQAVSEALEGTDVLLISGGISVGDYDFVNEVLQENGTETLFYKAAQKPGKPLFYGKNNGRYIFGLPGNPASALVCFYEYVFPVLRLLQGKQSVFLKSIRLPVSNTIQKKKGLAHFLKAFVEKDMVEVLDGQESFKLKSFAEANAFIYLHSEIETVNAGEIVEVHLLPEY